MDTDNSLGSAQVPFIDTVLIALLPFAPLLIAVVLVSGTLTALHYLLLAKQSHLTSEQKLPRQVGMLVLTIVGAVVIAMALPVSESTRNQVIALIGVLISGVIAFSSTTMVGNLMAGIVLRVNRPFKVGDWIRSPDQEIEGTVEAIGWRLTRIRTFDKRPLYVPNSTFTNISVENPSRMHNRRIYETVGVRYDDAQVVESIVKGVKTMLKNHPEIDHTQTLIVNLNHFGPSSLDIMIYTFTRTVDWVKYHEVKQDILVKVMETIQLHGAEIAYPTSTLHLASMPEPG